MPVGTECGLQLTASKRMGAVSFNYKEVNFANNWINLDLNSFQSP